MTGLQLPITLRVSVPLSDAELIQFSRKNVPYRIERNEKGELEIMSPVGSEGGRREVIVMTRLEAWAEEHGGITFSSNVGFTLRDGSVRSPDASWLSESSWNALSEADQARYAPVCPEFLIEVLSESDSRPVLEAKMQHWIDSGAQLAWMIDPFSRTVSIYRPGSICETLVEPEVVEADAVVAGFRLSTARLWKQ